MKKFITIAAAIAALAATSTMNTTAYAADTPAISVSIVGDTIISGDSAEYTIIYEGNVSLITISEKSIGLKGFSADKAVTLNDDNTATLSLTNIVDLEGNNTIRVAGGTAITKDKIMTEEVILENIVIADNPSTGVAGIPIFPTLVSSVAAFAFHKKKK